MNRKKTQATPQAVPRDHHRDAITVRLSDIVLDPKLQVRRRIDPGTVSKYADAMRAGQQFPPIKVANVNGACVLVGGWHRVEAAKRAGLDALPAEIVTARYEELRWIGAEDNMKHGLPPRRHEAREVFRAYVKARQYRKPDGSVKSSREIAADLHGMRSHVTILGWMEKDAPAVHRIMIKDEPVKRADGEPTIDPTDPMKPAREHIAQIIALARGLGTPENRGELIAALEEARAMVERVGPWKPHEVDF